MRSDFQPFYPTQPKAVAIWSPHPFQNFFQYQNLFQRFLQNYPQLLCLECRFGYSEKTLDFLKSADLILLLLDQSRSFMKGISLDPVLYRSLCYPILCNYRKYYEPTPEDLILRFRLCGTQPGIMTARAARQNLPEISVHRKSLCVQERRGSYGSDLSGSGDSDAQNLCIHTFFHLQQIVETLLLS